MWFVFPQLIGLGHSAMAQRYAIRDLEQAKRYLADPILGGRLRDNVWRIIGHKGKTALDILGSPDDLKFRSCLTLFAEAASDSSDRMLFKEALNQFYNGTPDRRTLELLHSKPKLEKNRMSLPLDTGGGQGFTSIPKGYDGASTWTIASADCISRSKAKNRLYRGSTRAASRVSGPPLRMAQAAVDISTSTPGNNAKRSDPSASESIHLPYQMF
jgi:uncharacterized protein (DUF1810 family)